MRARYKALEFAYSSPCNQGPQSKPSKTIRKKAKEVEAGKTLLTAGFADYFDIPKYQIGRIERGQINPPLSTIYSISSALDLPLEEFLKGL